MTEKDHKSVVANLEKQTRERDATIAGLTAEIVQLKGGPPAPLPLAPSAVVDRWYVCSKCWERTRTTKSTRVHGTSCTDAKLATASPPGATKSHRISTTADNVDDGQGGHLVDLPLHGQCVSLFAFESVKLENSSIPPRNFMS